MAGGHVEILAEQLGNTPKTIFAHYSHVCQDHKGIASAVDRFGLKGFRLPPSKE